MQFDLIKETEVLQLELTKRGADKIIPCQVKLALDVSGSFDDEHQQGYTQALINRLVPYSMIFDKDKVLDCYTFSHLHGEVGPITERNYSDFVKKHVIDCYGYNGATVYSEVIQQILEDSAKPKTRTVKTPAKGFLGKLFGTSTTKTVVDTSAVPEKELIFFITDGECDRSDVSRTTRVIEAAKAKNVFFVFISVGNYDIDYFKSNFESTPYSMYLRFTKPQLKKLKEMSDESINDLLLKDNLINWMND